MLTSHVSRLVLGVGSHTCTHARAHARKHTFAYAWETCTRTPPITSYQMMEDADGYNQIWLSMQLVFAELVQRPGDVAAPAMIRTISNFRDYIAPDGQ